MEMDSKYHVGDKVRVVDNILSREMAGDFIGTEQKVREVRWCELCDRYEYRVTGSALLWCDDDFEFDTQTELPEFNASELSLKDLFN